MFEIISQKEVAPNHYLLVFSAPDLAAKAKPGQFVHVRCGESFDPLLRRPISIHALDYHKGEIALLYRVVGKGTGLLSQKKAGETLDVLGPLGQGFVVSSGVEKIALVGGGMGAAPLLALAQDCLEKKVKVYFLLGASSKEYLLIEDELARLGVELRIATDDGSQGIRGNTVDLLQRLLVEGKIDLICACGPKPMLRGVARMALSKEIECQVSLEEKMACGVGACLGCVCRAKTEDGQDTYRKVCQHGPVFDGKEVQWDE